MSAKLAIHGGMPIQPVPLNPYISIGAEEKAAVDRVMATGSLSGFVACDDDRFYGGHEVRSFEKYFADLLGAPYAVSFNSASSGLVAAVTALGVGIGDEVIVPAQTMSASAAAALATNAVPVFADVEGRTYGMDPQSVRSRISDRTKALMIVHLYGHPARMDELMSIAEEHQLKVIEDCSQAPLASYHGEPTGTLGDVGVFSFNIHKHVNCGEGGIAVTADRELRERLAMVRNHGEMHSSLARLHPIVGWNYRLTELQAAIALEQTKKLKVLTGRRRELAGQLSRLLGGFPWVQVPHVEEGCQHSYYDFPMQLDFTRLGLTKSEFIRITAAENLPISESYRPIYWQHIYQNKQIGSERGFPFNRSLSQKNRENYRMGSCPCAERLFGETCLTFEICSYEIEEAHLHRIAEMFARIEQYCRG